MNSTKIIYQLFLLSCLYNNCIIRTYVSQVGQDKFLHERYFNDQRKGFFVDIGAHDGLEFSNTYFFEKELGWEGICFEPLAGAFELLLKNRNCMCVNACVGNTCGLVKFFAVKGYAEMLSGMVDTYHPLHFARMKRDIAAHGGSYTIMDVPSVTLESILEKQGVYKIDYLSLDTEGGELEILQSIDFNKIKILAISVENNYEDPDIRTFLESQGFEFITFLGGLDEIYVNNNF
ncbi:MAG: FkbM family methyltransferase [Candidatus Babeliaceae bacterium]|jgi:FkbM family methyltransferase